MSYVVPIHRPSGVRHAVKLNFIQPNVDSLVVAKANRLDIYETSPDGGLSLLASKSIYGYITILERLRPMSSKTDHLFVGTDRYQYFTCSWDAASRQLKTEQSYVDLADKVLRDSRESDRCRIDPARRYMTLELYDGVVTVVPFVQTSNKRVKRDDRSSSGAAGSTSLKGPQAGTLGEPVQVRIEELLTRDSAFLEQDPESTANPQLAILWEDNAENPQLKLRELQMSSGAGGDQPIAELPTVAELSGDQLDKGVSHLIPVPAPYGGFLILGDAAIRYVDSKLRNVITQPLGDNTTLWTCWAKIEENRWLLADDFGRLFFLMIEVQNFQVVSWRLDDLGRASKAACLVYLGDGLVFVGSHSGDSQVVALERGGVRVLQKFDNLAPILDFSIMDLGRAAEAGPVSEFSSGQARIVAAAGAWQDGTVRSIRSGVGLEELGTIGELAHITNLWALSSTGVGDAQDVLLASFIDETRVFTFDAEASVEEVDTFNGLEFSRPTLLAANFPGRQLIQVVDDGIRAADLESHMVMSYFKPQDPSAKNTAACANADHLLVVEGGTTLHVFEVGSGGVKHGRKKSFPATSSQISDVTIPKEGGICVVSFWQTASVAILDLSTLETIYTQTLGTPGTDIPRSVLVSNIMPAAPPTLFIAMADGTVVSYSLDLTAKALSNPSRILLGTEPVVFKELPRDDGLANVFASCEQPSLIYSSEGRIIYSAVNAESASRVCHFNSDAYPDAIAIASPSELKLALIDKQRTTQLQTLHVGETVRCLTYEPSAKLFAMGCVRRIIESGVEEWMSSVQIADEVSFKTLDSVELQDRELVECVVSTGPFETDDETSYGEMFVVGTSLLEDDANGEEQAVGRIIVYEINKEKKIKEVTQLKVKGSCRSLAMCEGKIVAGLVKTVVLYGLTPTPTRSGLQLTKLASYRTSTNPLSLAITPANSAAEMPAFIAVADLMKSLSILALQHPTGADPSYKLVETSRHFATVWSSSTAPLSGDEWVLADMEGNLITLRQQYEQVGSDSWRRMELTGEFRLGEMVNKIVALPATHPDSVVPNDTGKNKKKQRADSSVAATSDPSSSSSAGVAAAASTAARPAALPRTGPLVVPKAFLGTVEGAVYLLCSIAKPYINPLLLLQGALAGRVAAPGGMPWARFRAHKTEVSERDEPFRFVDGAMLEAALVGLDDAALGRVLQEAGLMKAAGEAADGTDLSVAEVRRWGEELRRLA